MDEGTWLGSNGIRPMLAHLTETCGVQQVARGRRKLRLFMCACLRRAWPALGRWPGLREEVEAAEAMADGAPCPTAPFPPFMAGPQDEAAVIEACLSRAAYFAQQSRNLRFVGLVACDTMRTGMALLECQSRGLSPTASEQGLRVYQTAQESEEAAQAALLRDIFGNPFRPPVRRRFPSDARSIAQACYDGHAEAYLVLADALDDLGEPGAAAHCRSGAHAKGCHVVDWVRGQT